MRWLARLAAGVGLLASVVLPSTGALAAPSIDQMTQPAPWASYLFPSVGNPAAGEPINGEAIMPSRTGQLTALWLAGACNACTDILTVQVAEDVGSQTLGPVLASTAIRETAWPTGDLGGYVRIPPAPAVPVVAGHRYLVYPSHRTNEGSSQFHLDAVSATLTDGYFGFVFLPISWSLVGSLLFESEIDSALPAARVVNDTDPGLSYGGGGWFYTGGRPARIPDVGNDVHATTTNGDSVSYTFTGTGIAYLSELSDGYGLVDVYLDGAKVATVDANGPGVHNLGDQVLFQHSWPAAGQHTLTLVKVSGVYLLLDALVVQP